MPPQYNDASQPPPTQENNNSPGDSGNLKLIAITSSFAGAIFITFLCYVGIRLYRGHDIADILKLRRRSQRQQEYNEVEEPADLRTLPEPPSYIQMTQRFSVRSHRASKRLSLRSNKSRRAYNTRQPSSPLKPPTTPQHKSTDQRLARPPQSKRPPPIRVHTEPVPKILDSWLTSPSSTLVDSKTASPATDAAIARPEMVLVRKLSDGSNCMTPTKREFEALPQVVSLKRSTSKRITVTARTLDDDNQLRASPILARELRWSGSCSDLPPTPKLALERCPTAEGRPSQLRVEVKDSEAGPKKLSTDNARRVVSSNSAPNLKKARFLPSLSRGNSQQSSQRRVLTRPLPKP